MHRLGKLKSILLTSLLMSVYAAVSPPASSSADEPSTEVVYITVPEWGHVYYSAPDDSYIAAVEFASYGTPIDYQLGWCHSDTSYEIVSNSLAYSNTVLDVYAVNSVFGDPCYGTYKRLSVVLVVRTVTLLSPTPTPSETLQPTETPTPTYTPEPSTSPTQSPTPTPSITLSPTPTPESSASQSSTPSPPPTQTQTPTPEPTPTKIPKPTASPTVVPSSTPTQRPKPTVPLAPSSEPTVPQLVPSSQPSDPPSTPIITTDPNTSEQVSDASSDGVITAQEQTQITESLLADGSLSTQEITSLSDTLSQDGALSEEDKQVIADVLVLAFADLPSVPFADLIAADLTYADLPPSQPVSLENGVILTATVADAIQLLDAPSKLISTVFSDPGKALKAVANVGADMTPATRKTAQQAVVPAVIVSQVISGTASLTLRKR